MASLFKKKSSSEQTVLQDEGNRLCDHLSFAASEAYKLLRANLAFSMTSERSCHIIGITSAVRGEGKSTTAVNLSYTFAEAGNRTLLIEADMRLPIIGKRLNIVSAYGLSNVLAGQVSERKALQKSGYFDNWKILSAGSIPPNPSELLGSPAMKQLLERLSPDFDIIIIDLPPITIVSDALVISPLTDGIIMVVRQDYADKASVNEAVRQFRFSSARLLGFVLTCAGTENSHYKRYNKYKRYGKYKKYGYDYDYDYGYSDAYEKRKKHSTADKEITADKENERKESSAKAH